MLQVIVFLLTLQFLTQIRCCVLFIGLVLLAGLVLYVIVRFDDINSAKKKASSEPSNGNLKELKSSWQCIAALALSVMIMATILIVLRFYDKGFTSCIELVIYTMFSILLAFRLDSLSEEPSSRHPFSKILIAILIAVLLVVIVIFANTPEDAFYTLISIAIIELSIMFAVFAIRLCRFCFKAESADHIRRYAIDTITIVSASGIILTMATVLLDL